MATSGPELRHPTEWERLAESWGNATQTLMEGLLHFLHSPTPPPETADSTQYLSFRAPSPLPASAMHRVASAPVLNAGPKPR